MSETQSFSAVIRAFPSQAALAAEMGERAGTVSAWAQRDRIPSNRWVALVRAAECLGVAGVDYELLARIDARGRRAGASAAADGPGEAA